MKPKPSPNEPCWCGLGRKYKKCHKAYDEAPDDRKYAEAQRHYATLWEITSRRQHERRHYDGIADQLRPHDVRRLFDVGCGSGHGFVSLLARLPHLSRVVSIDENPHCL